MMFETIKNAVGVEGLAVMGACFVAVVWWAFRGRATSGDGDGDEGGDGGID